MFYGDSADTSECEVIFQTTSDLAICVREEGENRDIWLPKSYTKLIGAKLDQLERGDTITVECPDWILEREGLI